MVQYILMQENNLTVVYIYKDNQVIYAHNLH